MRNIIMTAIATLTIPLAHAAGDTVLGDWGHFLSYDPKIYLNNPDGKAFSITIHQMKWTVDDWNAQTTKASLTDPAGKPVFSGEHRLKDAECTLTVPAGPKGVYLLETHKNVWVSSTLKQSVVWTGEPGKHMIEGRWAIFQSSVPRRWWFWVPADVTGFTCHAQRADRYMSQREDWGIFIISPRGQRIRALWGQPPHTPPKEYRQNQSVHVEVEPGAAGRFWCVEAGYGDSHNYSKCNVCLEGIPPYLSRSPEEWFDPTTGNAPEINPYDDTPFIQSARDEEIMLKRWPNLQHFSPCPSLGDPDGVEVLGDARFALWNPEGRELGLRIGTYLPRTMPKKDPAAARVVVTGTDGLVMLDKNMPMQHIHGKDGHPTDALRTGKGVCFVDVSNVERWLAFTYPAVPTVLVGETERGWKRFSFSACTARNWYFLVPAGTRRFSVRAEAEHATDVVSLEICSPDRTMAIIYDNKAEREIGVPDGLDGKIWYLRPSAGSATRIVTDKPDYRYQDLLLTIHLKGVPGFLSPTWEQWFDPTNPKRPSERAGADRRAVGRANPLGEPLTDR